MIRKYVFNLGLVLVFFTKTSSVSIAQLNTDSLILILNDDQRFQKKTKIQYLIDSFQRYESTTHNEHYDVYYDSTGKLAEYCGLAIVYRQFDSVDRILKIIGYAQNGEFRLWDYSPVTYFQYRSDSTIKDYYDNELNLQYRLIIITDGRGRVIEEQRINGKAKIESKTVKQYSDSNHSLTILFLDGSGKFKPNKFGVSVILQKYDEKDSGFITETNYLDSNWHAVDANHDGLDEQLGECRYSKVIHRDDIYGSSYCNAKGEISCDFYWIYEK